MATTSIEWTDQTWNPVTGCDRVSPGCDNCYALTLARRLQAMGQEKYRTDGDPRTSGPGFGVAVHPQLLTEPYSWKSPRRVFVNSMSDAFHARVPLAFLLDMWEVMAATPQHTYQILTKRPLRMRRLVGEIHRQTGLREPLPNVWLGVSAEDQKRADDRIPHLLRTPAAVRFISAEPLLGSVSLARWLVPWNRAVAHSKANPTHILGPYGDDDFTHIDCDTCDFDAAANPLHWVITGGESGPSARPMHPTWATSLRDQCLTAQVAYFHKQNGEYLPAPSNYGPDVPQRARPHTRLAWAGEHDIDGQLMLRVGRQRAGRELDGRTWDQYPKERHA